jgi:hypothetical protein
MNKDNENFDNEVLLLLAKAKPTLSPENRGIRFSALALLHVEQG